MTLHHGAPTPCADCGTPSYGLRCRSCYYVDQATRSTTKICRRCGEEKPRGDFYDQSGRCKSCCRAAAKEWKLANTERAIETQKRRDRERPDLARARRRKHYLANVEKVKARAVEYHRAHPEQKREWTRRRRARIRGAAGGRTNYAEIRERDGDYCYLCGQPLGDAPFDFDHVVPLARGGPHSAENIRVTHSSCNRRKGARLVEECPWAVPLA